MVGIAGHHVVPDRGKAACLCSTLPFPALHHRGQRSCSSSDTGETPRCQDLQGGTMLSARTINQLTGRDLHSSGPWSRGHGPPLTTASPAQLSSTHRSAHYAPLPSTHRPPLHTPPTHSQAGRRKECRRTADISHHLTPSAQVSTSENALYVPNKIKRLTCMEKHWFVGL